MCALLVVDAILPVARLKFPTPSALKSALKNTVPDPALTLSSRKSPSRACKPSPALVLTTAAVKLPLKLATNALVGVRVSPMVSVPIVPRPPKSR